MKKIKIEKPVIKQLKCLLRLNEQILSKGNLKEYQINLWKDLSDEYYGTVIIIRSDFKKNFGFFTPNIIYKTN